LPLEHDVGAHEEDARVVEEGAEDGGSVPERQVGHDLERLARPPHAARVALVNLDCALEARPQALRPRRVDLDGDHPRAAPDELRGEDPAARSHFHHEIAGVDTCLVHDRGGEPCATKEVLAVRGGGPRCADSAGHGTSP
jgi:hypothetical protein